MNFKNSITITVNATKCLIPIESIINVFECTEPYGEKAIVTRILMNSNIFLELGLDNISNSYSLNGITTSIQGITSFAVKDEYRSIVAALKGGIGSKILLE